VQWVSRKERGVKKIRTIQVPLMGVWDRLEYLSSRRAMLEYQQVEVSEEALSVIQCNFCSKNVLENQIHVVEYGEKVACAKCFRARYLNRRQLYKHLPVPPDLNPADQQESTDLSTLEAVDKAVEIQDRCVTQIRQAAKLVDPEAPEKAD
jgi:hypothetical protein